MMLQKIRDGIDKRIDGLEDSAFDSRTETLHYACVNFILAWYRLLYAIFNQPKTKP